LPVIYLIILIGFAASYLKKEDVRVIRYLPITVFILHFSYAMGFLSGIIKLGINKIRKIF
jgi:hypothetical protein